MMQFLSIDEPGSSCIKLRRFGRVSAAWLLSIIVRSMTLIPSFGTEKLMVMLSYVYPLKFRLSRDTENTT